LSRQINVAVCEDTKKDKDLLVSLIKELAPAANVCVFDSGEAFLDAYKKGIYHLVYLDVYMSCMTGMDVAKAIREKHDDVPIAFTTTSREHSLEANRFRSVHYIEKPVTADAIAHTMTIAEAVRQHKEKESLNVTDNNRRNIDIAYCDISYIDVSDHRCVVHLEDGGEVVVRTATTIGELDAALSDSRFFRCHRSYIINLDHVGQVDRELSIISMYPQGIAYVRRGMFKNYKNALKLWLLEKAGNNYDVGETGRDLK